MKRLALSLLFLYIAPLSATVTHFQWEGRIDRGGDPSTSVHGDFTYDDQAPTFQDGDGRTLHDGSINSVNLFIGDDHYASINLPWFSTVDPIPSFSELNLIDLPNAGTNNFSWDRESWYIAFNDGENTWREIGGKVVSFWTSGGYVPPVPGRDTDPVPEPSTFVLCGVALLGYLTLKAGRNAARRRL